MLVEGLAGGPVQGEVGVGQAAHHADLILLALRVDHCACPAESELSTLLARNYWFNNNQVEKKVTIMLFLFILFLPKEAVSRDFFIIFLMNRTHLGS